MKINKVNTARTRAYVRGPGRRTLLVCTEKLLLIAGWWPEGSITWPEATAPTLLEAKDLVPDASEVIALLERNAGA